MVSVDGLHGVPVLVGDVARETRVHERVVQEARARLSVHRVAQHLVESYRDIAAQITPEGEARGGEPGAELVVTRLGVHRVFEVDRSFRVQLQEEHIL